MLKLVHNTARSKCPEAHIIITPDMAEADRERLAGLAAVFFGHPTPSKDRYIFTEVRGEKCWLLYRHGFAAVPDRHSKGSQHYITHPKDRRLYATPEAIACCRLMEPVEPVMQTAEEIA